jgi:hypothetical protein
MRDRSLERFSRARLGDLQRAETAGAVQPGDRRQRQKVAGSYTNSVRWQIP